MSSEKSWWSMSILDRARPEGVIRMAMFMGVAPRRKPDDTTGSYVHKCKLAILREEKRVQRSKED